MLRPWKDDRLTFSNLGGVRRRRRPNPERHRRRQPLRPHRQVLPGAGVEPPADGGRLRGRRGHRQVPGQGCCPAAAQRSLASGWGSAGEGPVLYDKEK